MVAQGGPLRLTQLPGPRRHDFVTDPPQLPAARPETWSVLLTAPECWSDASRAWNRLALPMPADQGRRR
jgi:hypothetical protein